MYADTEQQEDTSVVNTGYFQFPRVRKWRTSLWILLDVPNSSWPAKFWALFISTLIVISILVFMLETLPEYYRDPPEAFFWIEMSVVIIFTIEIILRLATTPSYKQFFLSRLNYIDILSVLPFYIEICFPGREQNFGWLRVLRVVRVIRIFKLGRYQNGFNLFYLTLKSSFSTLVLGLAFLVLGMITFSSFMFYAEQTYSHFDDDEEVWYYNDDTILAGEESFFQSIPHTFWWCIVTMTTVGYGDTYPISPLGKTVAAITFLGGLAIIAFPIGILGSKFLDVFLESEAKKKALRMVAKEAKNEGEETDEFPFFPDPVKELLKEKITLDKQLVFLEDKVKELKQQSKKIDRALQLFNWERNPSLIDITYEEKITELHRQSNLPFKTD